MATLTTAEYLDGGTARSAGEVFTFNGGSLTVRTDTRWHANAPASMTGTFGGSNVISATLGGELFADSTAVRWMSYDTGSGTVPAIGTTITQGGVSGYLLGVWSSYTSAPTAVGASMPSTGWLKFREVTGGAFALGALTGISASATEVDRQGWIEIVADQAYNLNVPRLGKFKTRGGWFYLDDTTGSAGQILQVPTNGGGTGTEAPGCWIETGVGTDVYELYPSLETTHRFTTTDLDTDERCKFVHNALGGQLRIGSDGSNSIGYVPPAGCKVRIPSNFFRQCTSGARATNATPHGTIATRPDFTTTSAGAIDIEYFYGDWYLIFAQAYSVKLHHVASFDSTNISECATALDLLDGGVGMTGGAAGLDIRALQATSCFAGGTITDWRGQRGNAAGSNDHSIDLSYCIGTVLTRVQGGILAYTRSTGYPIYVNQCTDITLNECRGINAGLLVNTSFGITINNFDHVDRYRGTTNSTTARYAIAFTNSCGGVKVDGMTFGMNGLIANVHPYNGCVSYAASSDIKVRNIGTRAVKLSGGSANNPAYIAGDLGNNVNVKVQRCYMTPTRTRALLTVNSTKNFLAEHVYGDYADADTRAALNMTVRGCGLTTAVSGQASVYGTHWADAFSSNTVGRIVASMNEATAETAAYNTLTAGAGSGFTSAGGLSLANVSDEYITEMPYSMLGHLTLSATAPVVTGTNVTYSSGSRWGNHDIYYQVDTGSGYGGTWLNFTNNLSQSINVAGTKFKLRIVCAVAAATNLVSFIRMNSTTSTAAMDANMYPLDTINLTLTGLVTGSDIVILSAGTETVRVQVDAHGSTTYNYVYETPENIDIAIYKSGQIPFFIRNYALASSDASLPVAQVPDTTYLE